MDDKFRRQWNRFLEIIRDNVGADRFDTWFACAVPVDFKDSRLTIGLPSSFYYEKYEDDFYEILTSALRRIFGKDVKLDYEVRIVDNDSFGKVRLQSPEQSHAIRSKLVRSTQQPANPGTTQSAAPDIDPQLNESLTFENYCLGESNRLPYTIAEHIANNPGKHDFNPFFLYGEVGVGKTHLIQAIGIRIKERNPRAKVLFIPMRQFQNLVANAYMQKKVPGFLNWFQQMDALLFDDLQELSTKEATMQLLFPIFNHLHQNNRTLVFTCDRPPVELDGITDRLIDRFKWGITEKLPKPDTELRKKILQYKASKNGLALPVDVIDCIAENSTGSVRELEGIVMGLMTRSITLNADITLDMAREVMSHSIKISKKCVNFEMVVDATAEYYHIDPDVIFSRCKVREVADARQVIMYLANKVAKLSSASIGHKLNRSHTTVLHGISTVKDRMPYSRELYNALETIEQDLRR